MLELIPEDRRAEIKARFEAATPGPWFTREDYQEHQIWDVRGWKEDLDPIAVLDAHCGQTDNAAFIARARTDLPDLYAENEALRAELERVTRELEAAKFQLQGRCETCAFVEDCAKHDNNDLYEHSWYEDCDEWGWRGPRAENTDSGARGREAGSGERTTG